MKILQLNNIEVNYGNINALKGIDVEIEKGEIVSLIGANGAGKSTLLKAIVAIEPIRKGTIYFEDSLLIDSAKNEKKTFLSKFNFTSSQITTDKITARGISLVPEGREVFADMSVLENLEMGAFLVKDKNKISTKLEEMFNYFPILRDRKDQKAGSLSGGEQQMLAIARGLMSSPKLLLLDEPGLGLAPLIIKDIFDIIVKINKEENVTIFLIEQNAKMALKTSNRGYVMETGNIVMHDKSSILLEDAKIKATYLGE